MTFEIIALLDEKSPPEGHSWLNALPQDTSLRYIDCRSSESLSRSLDSLQTGEKRDVLLIDTSRLISESKLELLIETLRANYGYNKQKVFINTEQGNYLLARPSANKIVNQLVEDKLLCFCSLITSSDRLNILRDLESCNSTTVMAALSIAQILGEQDPEIINLNRTVQRSSFSKASNAAVPEMTLTSDNRSSLLRFVIGLLPIEELFPDHPWSNFPEESAAACYQTLAATFLIMQDFEAVQDCLNYSDQFEDSPRSLALKGLLAYQQGESLTAVASLVSSLQEYEKRKKDVMPHYQSFNPQNLEMINQRLNSGLIALNEKDNHLAFRHFSEAVWNFDGFFKTTGLTMPS